MYNACTIMYIHIRSQASLLGKPPLPHKMQKNNVFFTVSRGRAGDLSLLKTKLHKCGRGMYPNECCKIQPSNENDIPTYCNHIMQSYHHIIASFHSAMNLILLHIISFHLSPCRFTLTIVFLHHSPATSIGNKYI